MITIPATVGKAMIWLMALMLITLPTAIAAPADDERVCSVFRKLLSNPPFVLGYELERIVDDHGKQRVPNVDVDGDGRIDLVFWECPRTGTSMPADPCTVRVEFANGRIFEFEEVGITPVRFRSKLYALAASMGRTRKAGDGSAWVVDGKGIRRACSSL